jgi:hypothetical protein
MFICCVVCRQKFEFVPFAALITVRNLDAASLDYTQKRDENSTKNTTTITTTTTTISYRFTTQSKFPSIQANQLFRSAIITQCLSIELRLSLFLLTHNNNNNNNIISSTPPLLSRHVKSVPERRPAVARARRCAARPPVRAPSLPSDSFQSSQPFHSTSIYFRCCLFVFF